MLCLLLCALSDPRLDALSTAIIAGDKDLVDPAHTGPGERLQLLTAADTDADLSTPLYLFDAGWRKVFAVPRGHSS
eukprot:scaffold66322_cov59-Phaeocystis_antarctica.AAC.1